MNTLEEFKKNKYLIWALFFALLNMGVIFFIFGFQEYGDTSQYIQTIHWFQGKEVEPSVWRIIRPIGSLIAVPFEFLGEGAGLIVQNIIFYLLCAFLMFKITELIYHNSRQAFFASLFFVTATSVIEVGLAYLTDTGGWFFFLLSIFLTLLYFKNKNGKLIIINGLVSSIGVLLKESGGLGAPFFGLMILLSRDFKVKEKILKIISFGIIFLIPIIIVQFFMFQYFRFSSLNLFHTSIGFADVGESWPIALLRYSGQLFRILGILWPLILIGLWREWREKNWERIKIFLALLPSSFTFLLWHPAAGARTVFFFAPLGILLATYGLSFLENKLSKKKGTLMVILLLTAILTLNYWFCWSNPHYSFFEIIAGFLGIL